MKKKFLRQRKVERNDTQLSAWTLGVWQFLTGKDHILLSYESGKMNLPCRSISKIIPNTEELLKKESKGKT